MLSAPPYHVSSTNLKPFVIGLVICSMGGYLAFEMLQSTSWTSYADREKGEYPGEFGEVTYDYDYKMQIGLQNSKIDYRMEECDENEYCFQLEIDEEFKIMENPLIDSDGDIDCENTDDSDEIVLCDTVSSGSTGYKIIAGGLGLLALTLLLSFISVIGYIPGWITQTLEFLCCDCNFHWTNCMVCFDARPKRGNEPGEAKWGLSYAFYLTLTSSPVIFVGGLFFGSMEAFALDKDEDWEDDEYDEADDDYSEFSSPMSNQNSPLLQRESPSPNWQGAWGDDGYEWIEHPEGSEIWFWRDQETGQWVRH